MRWLAVDAAVDGCSAYVNAAQIVAIRPRSEGSLILTSDGEVWHHHLEPAALGALLDVMGPGLGVSAVRAPQVEQGGQP